MIRFARHNDYTCVFNPQNHIYRIKETGERLVSVTTLINRYFPRFDAPVIAQKVAQKRGGTPQEWMDEWARLRQIGADEGTNVHKFCEAWWRGEPKPEPISLAAGKKMHQAQQVLKKLAARLEFVEAEKIVFSPSIEVAGQVDLILFDPKKKEIVVIDYKQNKKISDKNPWESCLSPISHLDACDTIKYALQLTIYILIMQNERFYPDATGFRAAIIHIQEDSYRLLKVDPLWDEAKALFLDRLSV